MTQSLSRYVGLALAFFVIAASVAILNVTPAETAQAQCQESSGGGGGGGGGASPSGSSTPSPSGGGGGGGLPVTIPPIPPEDEESSTPSGSPSNPPGEDNEPQRCSTNITIAADRARASSTTVNFHGSVRSKNSVCERGRKISLKRKKAGPDLTVGNTISNRRGKWSVKEPNARGRYYAVGAKRKVGSVNCLAGRSKTIDA